MSDKVATENQGFMEEEQAEGENSPHIGSTLCGRQSVSVAVDAFGVCSDLVLPDQAEEAAVKGTLLQRTPQMFMPPTEEWTVREEALLKAVEEAAKQGMASHCVARLREMVMERHRGAFRRALTGNPPARVQPMVAKRKQGTGKVRARPKIYSPRKTEWLAKHFAQLEAAGMVFRNPQATFASVAMAVPKGDGFRMVADYRAVNQLVEQAAMPMPRLEELGMLLKGSGAFCTLDMIQGYWQTPLHESAQELFTMVTTGGLFTPTRVPQGVLNATSYFQASMAEILDGMIGKKCLVWVDDIVIWAKDSKELLETLGEVLRRLAERGLYAAAHEAAFFQTEIKWCGRVYSGEATLPDPDRVQGLLELRRPGNGGELMHFVHAIGWLRSALPELAELEAPLRNLLEDFLQGTKHTRRAADRRVLTEGDWTAERVFAWEQVRARVAQAVPVYHRKEGYRVLVFTDASDLFWGGAATQVQDAKSQRDCRWLT